MQADVTKIIDFRVFQNSRASVKCGEYDEVFFCCFSIHFFSENIFLAYEDSFENFVVCIFEIFEFICKRVIENFAVAKNIRGQRQTLWGLKILVSEIYRTMKQIEIFAT